MEDPEDDPREFIPIIEQHNARLVKAHLLMEATQEIIHQKWEEGTTLDDIGKFFNPGPRNPTEINPCRRECYKLSST